MMARPVHFQVARPAIELDSTKQAGWSIPPGEYGLIEAAASGILNRAQIPLNLRSEGHAVIKALCSPDPESKSLALDGRRLVRIEGGFVVVNFRKYRDKDHTGAERQAEYRKRKREQQQELMLGRNGNVTEAEEEVEEEEEKEKAKKARYARCSYGDFVKACTAVGEKPLPPDDAAFVYAASINLPTDFLRLCWREFAARTTTSEVKYKGIRGWRQAFGNCVRGNWYKLWWKNETEWALTTAGQQAKQAHADRRAAVPVSNGAHA